MGFRALAGAATVFVAGFAAGCPAEAFPAEQIDRLVLSTEELNELLGLDGPDALSRVRPAEDQLFDEGPGAMSVSPARCAAALSSAQIFGSDFTAFRRAGDIVEGVGANAVAAGLEQALAVYPSEAAAQAAFERAISSVRACGADFAVRAPDGASRSYTVSVRQDRGTAVRRFRDATDGREFSNTIRAVGDVLIEVDSDGRFGGSDSVVAVVDRIQSKIAQ